MTTNLRFNERGLIPAIVQDARTHQVLMMAYMNQESLRLTQSTGETHFWSRSRQMLWHKGGTSGNVQRVREIRYDCDSDTLLILVDPAGPACHTGAISCFYRTLHVEDEREAGDSMTLLMDELEATLRDRIKETAAESYTARLLLAGEDEIVKKIGEEAVEIILAVKGQGNERVIEESADLVYHLLVMLLSRGLSWTDVEAELARRRKP